MPEALVRLNNYKQAFIKLVLHFPVAIHNQLVDKRLFGKLQQMLDEKRLKYTKVGLANRAFETDFMLSNLTKRYPTPKRI